MLAAPAVPAHASGDEVCLAAGLRGANEVGTPGGFYANPHDAAHPEGALRGQFHRLGKPVDLGGVLHGSDQATLSSQSDGGQEVRGNGGEQRGDADGRAVWWLRPGGSSITGVAGVAPACSPTPPRSCA